MSGTPIFELASLLRQLRPELSAQQFLFISLPNGQDQLPPNLTVMASFREAEGLSLVVDVEQARRFGLDGEGPFAMICLQVHSALEAVGMTAAVATALTQHAISANIIAAYHHDYVFVPAAVADQALRALLELSASARVGPRA